MKILSEQERQLLDLITNQISDITNGVGINRAQFPEEMKGSMAKRYWDDSMFTYGLEYGTILGLLMIKEKITGNKILQ